MTPSDTPSVPEAGAPIVKKRPVGKPSTETVLPAASQHTRDDQAELSTPISEEHHEQVAPAAGTIEHDTAHTGEELPVLRAEDGTVIHTEERLEDTLTPPLFIERPDLIDDPMPIDAIPDDTLVEEATSTSADGVIDTTAMSDQERLAHRFAQVREQRLQEGVENVTPVTAEEVFASPEPDVGTQHNNIPVVTPVVPAPTPPVHTLSKTLAMGEATQHLRAVQGDLDGFAQQITLGEFGANGSGDAGRAWRAIAAAPQEEAVDIWGEMMAISTGLWAREHILPSIAFLERASQDFTIPPEWEGRVVQSLQTAKDYKAAMAAEDAYEAGRDEEAMEHAKTITNQAEAEDYRKDLSARSKRRALQLRIGFISAGVLILGLLVMSAIAIMTRDSIALAPPAPDVSGIQDALESMSEELRDQREIRDQVPGTTVDPTTPTPAPATGVPALDSALSTPPAATATPPVANTQTPTEAVLPPVPAPAPEAQPQAPVASEPITPVEATPPAAPATGTFAPVQAPTAQTAAPTVEAAPSQDDGMISSCILGYAVMAEAEAMGQGQGPEVAQRLVSFAGTIEAACGPLNISPSTIVRGMATLDQATVTDMAQNILTDQP